AMSTPPIAPVFGFVRPPGWEKADPQIHEAFDELVAALGDQAFELPLPPVFDTAADQRRLINFAEMAYHYYPYWRDAPEDLGPEVRKAIEEGNKVLARDYQSAKDLPKVLTAALEELLTRCDVILCPSATGPAPKGLDTTGDPIFNGLWTFC
ncbi:amidase family protein, partial [Sulfitobacter sp. HI0040]